MRRNTAFMRGRTLPILIAGLVGYLIGGWHPTALRTPGDASAADTVALRFPQTWEQTGDKTSSTPTAQGALPDSGVLNASAVAMPAAPNGLSSTQLGLLDPQPMVPQVRQAPSLQTAQEAPPPEAARVQLASADISAPAIDGHGTRRPELQQQAAPVRTQRSVKAATAAVPRRPAERPGYMLDDAQIASIKQRLHLTPEQEQMWPAVEVALRNIAYSHEQQARGHAAQPSEVDPESVEGLKSAAVPLIMSFDDDQKQEVRNLAHVMGLDQLASQF